MSTISCSLTDKDFKAVCELTKCCLVRVMSDQVIISYRHIDFDFFKVPDNWRMEYSGVIDDKYVSITFRVLEDNND